MSTEARTSVRRVARPRFFAAAPDAPLARRAGDVIGAAGALIVAVTLSRQGLGGSRDGDLARALRSLGGSIPSVWQAFDGIAALWAVVVVGAVIARRHWRTAATLALGVVGTAALAAAAATLADEPDSSWRELLRATVERDGATFPAMRLAMVAALLIAASPALSRPYRRAGRVLIVFQLLAAVALDRATTAGALTALAVAVAAGALAHLVLGSPGGAPSLSVVRAALDELGVAAEDLRAVRVQFDGLAVLTATEPDGTPLEIRVYGRDAAEGRLLTSAWRFVWYRDSGSRFVASRLQQVEHEAFMMLLAGRLGEQTATMVPEVVIAGATAAGDALLVVRDPGASISDDPKPLDDTTVEAWWAALGRLHDAGMAHGRIDPTRLTRRADGRAALVDWSTAEVAATDDTRRRDDAQLLTTTAIAIGTERALDHARRALGDQGVGATLPWLQEPALGRTLRRALDQSDLELDSLRAEAATLTGNDEPELVKLRRITWGSIAQMLVLGFAGWLFVSNLADIGLDTITSQLGDARVGWLVAALVVGQLPRLANAVSTLGAAPVALPFGPTAALEYAITFINLAVPSSIGRMATKLRFLQRQGVNVVGATTMSALDSVTQFAVQMLILFVGLGLGLTTLDLDIDLDRIDTGQIARIAALVVAALAVVVMAVPAVRSRVVPAFAELRSGLRVLRTPRKAAQLFFGNLGAELLFAVTLGVCLAAFGGSAALIDLMVVNTGVALFAGIMPVPGGIGVSEAALTAGLSALGVPEPTAFAVAITYRMCTFYLPPLWGYVALRWLRGRRYL